MVSGLMTSSAMRSAIRCGAITLLRSQSGVAAQRIGVSIGPGQITLTVYRDDGGRTGAVLWQTERRYGPELASEKGHSKWVTEEMAVSHYFKRLSCILALFGDVDHHLGVVSDKLLAA